MSEIYYFGCWEITFHHEAWVRVLGISQLEQRLLARALGFEEHEIRAVVGPSDRLES
jgi:hypothetical protein